MFTQYFLKFASKEECFQELNEVGWCEKTSKENEELKYRFILDGHEGAIDEVGVIVDQQATYDPETFEELTPTTYLDGWHINVVLKNPLPEYLTPYLVTPTTPSRIFAGFEV